MLDNKLLVDLAFEYCTPQELAELTDRVKARLAGLRNAYKISGSWYTIKHTDHRVGGHNPPCGGNQSYDPGMVQAGHNLMLMGVITGGIPVFGAIVFALGAVITFFGSQVQANSNCVPLLALIPAVVDEQWFRDHVNVRYFVDDDWGNREVSPGELNWAFLEPAIYPSTPFVEITVNPTPRHDTATCSMTTIAALFKNWSQSKTRRARIDLYMDALPQGQDECIDYSIFNRDLYENEIIKEIPLEVKQRIIATYMDEVRDMGLIT